MTQNVSSENQMQKEKTKSLLSVAQNVERDIEPFKLEFIARQMESNLLFTQYLIYFVRNYYLCLVSFTQAIKWKNPRKGKNIATELNGIQTFPGTFKITFFILCFAFGDEKNSGNKECVGVYAQKQKIPILKFVFTPHTVAVAQTYLLYFIPFEQISLPKVVYIYCTFNPHMPLKQLRFHGCLTEIKPSSLVRGANCHTYSVHTVLCLLVCLTNPTNSLLVSSEKFVYCSTLVKPLYNHVVLVLWQK